MSTTAPSVPPDPEDRRRPSQRGCRPASGPLLLFVAAQAGFIDGPRVMANMAHDSWFPHRFSAKSDRLTMQNGVLLMGGAGLLMLLYKPAGAWTQWW